MEAIHTPGPWTVSISDDARIEDRITTADGAPIFVGRFVNYHNAQLIAAAPDLLAALQHALDRLESIPTDRDEAGIYRHAAALARAAISKATEI